MSTHHPPPYIDATDGVVTHGAFPPPRSSRSRRRSALSAVVAIGAAACLTALAPASASAAAPLVGTASDDAIPGRYIVALKGSPDTSRASESADAVTRAKARGVRPARRYKHAINGFAATLTPAQLDALRNDPDVAYIAADATVEADGRQSPATWGLDRIDRRDLPLNNEYKYATTGAGVKAYVIDTGIRTTHVEFGGRAVSGFDAVDGGAADDCHGHGTHVAGTLGGSTSGVAKRVRLVAVRALGCSGSGSLSGLIAAVDWVTNDHQAGEPAVANVSIGAPPFQPLDTAIANSIADGVIYVVSAGNDNVDACTQSPARAPDALTVGSTTSTDARRGDSNFGACVDLFAPGDSITSAWSTADTATNTIGGTSMASPHVAGVAAQYLQMSPQADPATIMRRILDHATVGRVTNSGPGSPNRLLYSGDQFATWAASPGVERVEGDFNRDGFGDIALVGGSGWSTIPIAFSYGDGTFLVTNEAVTDVPAWAQQSGAKPVAGDFNKDGYSDIALTGGVGWGSVPVAFSYGDGTFRVTNEAVSGIPAWAQASGAKPVPGDFNKDGFADIALVGGSGWGSVPIAFSYGNGMFRVTNEAVTNVPAWAQQSGAKPVAGDFNKDGYSDIALVGGTGWGSVPVAFSYGNGMFSVTNSAVPNFPVYAGQNGAKPVAGDFNKDGFADIALTGGVGWGSVPVAFSYGDGTFRVTNSAVPNFPVYAGQNGAKPVAGDFNKDGFADIALTGGVGWGSVPVAFSYGDGSFRVTNAPAD